MTNLEKWLWLTVKCGISRAKIKVMLDEVFKTIDNIYDAPYESFNQFRLSPTEKSRLGDKRIDGIANFIKTLHEHNVKIITSDMEEYPYLLKQTHDYPYVLYCRGKKFINLNDYICVAVVGSRKASPYGINVARSISCDAAKGGILIVSGMADGIDSAAHLGALDAHMPTVAVLGCGINRVYPASNAYLMKRIMETGMVITEYPPNAEPLKHHFPERNRIISGICHGTAVIEATFRSGSLITARLANDSSRDVFAVPGNINSLNSKGTNQLIKDGAYVLTTADDILNMYLAKYEEKLQQAADENTKDADVFENSKTYTDTIQNEKTDPTSPEEKIISALEKGPLHIDKIAELTHLDIANLSSALLMLEMNGKIFSSAGSIYELSV